MSCPIPPTRTYPLRKPPNHTLPVPRYTATLPQSTTHLHTLYIGLQTHSTNPDPDTTAAAEQVQTHIQTWIDSIPALVHETFALIDPAGGDPPGSKIWVCYQTSASTSSPATSPIPPRDIDIVALYATLARPARSALGLWKESFVTPVDRLETNYSGTDYLPGLARLSGVHVVEHDRATYWGAARDRIPESAWDLFPRGEERKPGVVTEGDGRGKVLRGTNAANVVHIRSGQWWANCGEEETAAYEGKLEPTLRAGLAYLNAHGGETGCMGIRYLRNDQSQHAAQRKETCGAGFFHNLEDLERWSRTHGSHLKIWRGALAHYKAFPENRRLRTWHEVSVIREGEARWEYVNCERKTGVAGSVWLDGENLE